MVMIMLDIHAMPKEDLGCAPAELVYGSTIRLPGEIFEPAHTKLQDSQHAFLSRLRQIMRSLHAKPPLMHGQKKTYVPPTLLSSDFVFVHHDALKSPLQLPYDGPYKVLE